jgi:hypothetical protein
MAKPVIRTAASIKRNHGFETRPRARVAKSRPGHMHQRGGRRPDVSEVGAAAEWLARKVCCDPWPGRVAIVKVLPIEESLRGHPVDREVERGLVEQVAVQRDPADDGYHGTDDKERSKRSVPERDHHDGTDDEDASHSDAKLRERHAHIHFVVGGQWPSYGFAATTKNTAKHGVAGGINRAHMRDKPVATEGIRRDRQLQLAVHYGQRQRRPTLRAW